MGNLSFDRSMVVTASSAPPPARMPSSDPSCEGNTINPLRLHVPPAPSGRQESQSVWTVPSDTLSFFNAERVTNPNCWLSGAQKSHNAPSEPIISSAVGRLCCGARCAEPASTPAYDCTTSATRLPSGEICATGVCVSGAEAVSTAESGRGMVKCCE